jgi:hypothetical protein
MVAPTWITPGCVQFLKNKKTFSHGLDPKRTRQMIRLADGVVFDYVVPIFNMVTSTAKDSNGA